MIRPALILALALISACAASPPLSQDTSPVSIQWHAANRFVVSYRADPDSREPAVTDKVLLQSAETALENGFPYFSLVTEALFHEFNQLNVSLTRDKAWFAPASAQNRVVLFRNRPKHAHYVALFVKASLSSRRSPEPASNAI